MKKQVVIFLLSLVCTASAFAQCGKKVVLISSKTEYLDSTYSLQKTVDENSNIELGKSEITIKPGDHNDIIAGEIKSDTCNWNTPYKQGKSIIRAVLHNNGDVKNATITIEGKDGRITFLLELDDMPNKKIRVSIDKFEEVM